jgi:hypothetical protein
MILLLGAELTHQVGLKKDRGVERPRKAARGVHTSRGAHA